MNKIQYSLLLLVLSTTIFSCNNEAKAGTAQIVADTLSPFAQARKGFVTKLTQKNKTGGAVELPPKSLFSIVKYSSNIGNMEAYLSKLPADGQLHPAIIWISGGFGNDISDVWTKADPGNDQTAATFWRSGIVTMYPAQRGGNKNPGYDESAFGEIDDILAAAAFLAKQPGIDTNRIYLGGHSTGGTKVLLVAACSKKFRAVFSFGATESMSDYGADNVTYDPNDLMETRLRTPAYWLSSIVSPVYVFEGTAQPGNLEALHELKKAANTIATPWLHFYEVKGKDHFSALQPVCKITAQKILEDNKGGEVKIDFEKDLQRIP